MNSLLNREGMKGQVQCIYFDPPYGIKYGGNWQMRINSTNVKESDDGISGEPEMIKARFFFALLVIRQKRFRRIR